MTMRPKPGKCVHCLRYCEILSWDHVFPEAWYPNTTPPNIEKWKIPSCTRCNNDYGALENDLMVRFGFLLDPNEPSSMGIVDKAIRAIDPNAGKSGKDKKARAKKQREILGLALSGRDIPHESLHPQFGLHEGQLLESALAIRMPKGSINRLAEKIVRGILYLEEGVFVGEDYEISTYVLTDEAAAPIVATIQRFGTVHAKEPGIVVWRATVPEDQTSSLFAIEIWNRAKLYSAVERITST